MTQPRTATGEARWLWAAQRRFSEHHGITDLEWPRIPMTTSIPQIRNWALLHREILASVHRHYPTIEGHPNFGDDYFDHYQGWVRLCDGIFPSSLLRLTRPFYNRYPSLRACEALWAGAADSSQAPAFEQVLADLSPWKKLAGVVEGSTLDRLRLELASDDVPWPKNWPKET